MSNPVRDQGKAARENFNALENAGEAEAYAAFNCPYGPGDNRDAWMAGFGGVQEAEKQVDVTAKSSASPNPGDNGGEARTVSEPKGKKGKTGAKTEVVTKTTGTGETSLKTVAQTADPENTDLTGDHDVAHGAEVNVTDPNEGTTAAQNDGVGRSTGVEPEDLL